MSTKFKPILFSTAMVQAILEGRKTQTRRVVKKQPKEKDYLPELLTDHFGNYLLSYRKDRVFVEDKTIKSLYGNVGDVLWVRETWKPGAWREDGRVAFDYLASTELKNTPWVQFTNFDNYYKKWTDEILKNNSIPDEMGFHHWEPGKSPLSWKPSIFMPKDACRLFVKIKSIRVEKLQDISEEDAISEGVLKDVEFYPGDFKTEMIYRDYTGKTHGCKYARSSYMTLWQKINGVDSWDENPYVWTLEFERIEKPKHFI